MIGTVYSGVNNIYRVQDEGGDFHECRIKGKILSDDEPFYNPLAPGDRVEFSVTDAGRGLISQRLDRGSRFLRWNKKGEMWQVVAANLDMVVIVMSADRPPFHPRFVDRVLINALQDEIPSAVLVNKIDLGIKPEIEARLAAWRKIGVETLYCSAAAGRGLEELKAFFSRKTAALFGPSGVGKSTLINRLVPGLELPTGEVSRKYNRGRHITNFGRLIDTPWGGRLIDTPGIREIHIRGIEPDELSFSFLEIAGLGQNCDFQPCSHRHEPGCNVVAGLEKGLIHSGRYENYVRIRSELEEKTRR